MNFRQRVAWLAVILFLTASFGFVYYIFEINEHFNSFALEHIQSFHGHAANDLVSSFWQHVADVPLAVWLLVFLLPYLQIFAMLLAWTRAEPLRNMAFLWPGILVHKCRKFYKHFINKNHSDKAVNSGVVCNGYVVIDT